MPVRSCWGVLVGCCLSVPLTGCSGSTVPSTRARWRIMHHSNCAWVTCVLAQKWPTTSGNAPAGTKGTQGLGGPWPWMLSGNRIDAARSVPQASVPTICPLPNRRRPTSDRVHTRPTSRHGRRGTLKRSKNEPVVCGRCGTRIRTRAAAAAGSACASLVDPEGPEN